MDQKTLSAAIKAAVFTALIIVGTFIKFYIPMVSPHVPVVLANLFVIMAGLLLGPLWGSVSVLLYLLIGISGIPVFSAGGGPAVFMGPTGGYLIGYLPAAFIAGLIARPARGRLILLLIAAFTGVLVIYLTGVPWLFWKLAEIKGSAPPLMEGLIMGAFLYLPGDALKIAAAALLTRSFYKLGLSSN